MKPVTAIIILIIIVAAGFGFLFVIDHIMSPAGKNNMINQEAIEDSVPIDTDTIEGKLKSIKEFETRQKAEDNRSEEEKAAEYEKGKQIIEEFENRQREENNQSEADKKAELGEKLKVIEEFEARQKADSL